MNIVRPVLVAALALASCSPSAPDALSAPAPLEGARIGGPFALTDQAGRTVTDRSWPGQYRVMYFGYTFCPDVCPTDTQAIGAGLRLLEGRDAARAAKVVPIFVTLDPQRDTPKVLAEFVAAFHPRMVGLTGSTAAIDAVAKSYAIFHAKGAPMPGGGYLVDHSRQAYLMSPTNTPVALIPQDQGPQAIADTLGKWVR